MDSSENIIYPRNLTGQVVVDKPEPKFMGNYSCVYRGVVEGHSVAVKVIKSTGDHRSVYRKVLRERTIWASLNHPNIHTFHGFSEDPEFAPFGALISPWCDKGDASRFLREHGPLMTERERIELWNGVIAGVAYLHVHTPMIIHGDLKPGNVLIDDLGHPRICDFGLARIFLDEEGSELTTTSEHTGTERYLAPELVTSETTVYPTTQSDVYALGCLGLEFVYLQKPYCHRKNNLRGGIIVDVRKGVPPATNPPQHSPHIWQLLKKCWHRDPNRRPLALSVAQFTAAVIPSQERTDFSQAPIPRHPPNQSVSSAPSASGAENSKSGYIITADTSPTSVSVDINSPEDLAAMNAFLLGFRRDVGSLPRSPPDAPVYPLQGGRWYDYIPSAHTAQLPVPSHPSVNVQTQTAQNVQQLEITLRERLQQQRNNRIQSNTLYQRPRRAEPSNLSTPPSTLSSGRLSPEENWFNDDTVAQIGLVGLLKLPLPLFMDGHEASPLSTSGSTGSSRDGLSNLQGRTKVHPSSLYDGGNQYDGTSENVKISYDRPRELRESFGSRWV